MIKRGILLLIGLCVLILVIILFSSGEKVTGNIFSLDNTGEAIIDGQSELMWQKSWIGRDFAGSVLYCDNLELAGYSDWRVPTINELETIADVGNIAPFKPATSRFWSSTETSETTAWVINFRGARLKEVVSKSVSFVVRCVRNETIEEISPECILNCTGKVCGDDGCGGSCGNCVEKEICEDNVCVKKKFNFWEWIKGLFS